MIGLSFGHIDHLLQRYCLFAHFRKTVDYRRHFPNPYNIQLQVVEHGGSNAPLETVSFGQDIKIRVIFDKNDMEEGEA